MMSNKKCCVPGCSTSEGSTEVLHRFPNPAKNRDLFNTWLYAVGGNILGLENDHIFKYRRVCQRHFDEKYWCRNNRLSNNAVPTIHMPVLGLSVPDVTYVQRRPLRSIQNLTEGSANDPVTLYSVTPEGPDNSAVPDKNETILEHSKESQILASVSPQPACQSAVDVCGQMKNYTEPVMEFQSPVITPTTFSQHTNKDVFTKNNTGHTGVSNIVTKRKLRSYISESEKHLHRKLIKVGIKLCKCRSTVKKQRIKINAMQDIMSHPQFLKILENMSSTAKLLIKLQFREYKKGTKGRRFTLDEKMKALSIFKQSPKGYRFFRKIFILPSPQTLIKLLSMADIRPGVTKSVLTQIKKATEKMKVEERLSILLFDEMSIKANVAYNERKDRVVGFVCNGEETQPEFADHAQVFMIRGLMKNYKQPVAYTFSQAATKGPELAKQLKEIISELQDAGLIIVATVCDQGNNNMQAIKLLVQETEANLLRRGEELRHNTFFVNNQEIIPLYDPPHLIKCVRNNLLTKNLNYIKNQKACTAKWSHITELHKENPGYKGIRLVPKLTDYHCVQSKIPKQKVKYATQLFSQTVGTNMGYLSEKRILHPQCKETADILIFFDTLFDSVNGSYGKRKKHGKPLLGAVTPTSIHHQVWEESKKFLKTMNFVKPNFTKAEYVPTLKNWVWTLEGIEYLLKELKEKYNITSVWLRHLNQDPIENFFGSIRSHGCRDINPTAEKFESAYITLLINSLSSAHAPGANCESDDCVALSDIIITGSDCKVPIVSLENLPDITITPLEEKAADPRKIGGLQYVSGFFLKNSKKHVFRGCKQCKIDLINDDEPEYIKYRQYSNKKWLCSPTDSLLRCISNLQDINYDIIKNNLEKNNLKELIKTIVLMACEFDFLKCTRHKEENISFLLKISCRFFIFNYCKEINRILNNKRECDDDEELFKLKARKHYIKTLKRKK